mmetsp:Transcript_27799/g.60806  ORF Transcript_27799/g.60806 Transcript_27799/m.60806 type:complete len:305 (-) Transcript_27799:611-1525(-)
MAPAGVEEGHQAACSGRAHGRGGVVAQRPVEQVAMLQQLHQVLHHRQRLVRVVHLSQPRLQTLDGAFLRLRAWRRRIQQEVPAKLFLQATLHQEHEVPGFVFVGVVEHRALQRQRWDMATVTLQDGLAHEGLHDTQDRTVVRPRLVAQRTDEGDALQLIVLLDDLLAAQVQSAVEADQNPQALRVAVPGEPRNLPMLQHPHENGFEACGGLGVDEHTGHHVAEETMPRRRHVGVLLALRGELLVLVAVGAVRLHVHPARLAVLRPCQRQRALLFEDGGWTALREDSRCAWSRGTHDPLALSWRV